MIYVGVPHQKDRVMRLRMYTVGSNWQIRRVWYCRSMFQLLLMSSSCFNKNACFGSCKFDSNFVNDECQPQIILLYQCCICTIDWLILQEVCYSLDGEASVTSPVARIPPPPISNSPQWEQYFPSTWSIGKWAFITGAHLRLLLIIYRIIVTWESAKTWYFIINTWKWRRI